MTLIQRHNKNFKKYGFKHDPSQLHAIELLMVLHNKLVQDAQTEPGLWQRLTQKRKLIPGVYLVGSVGRGKTYIMDLFYECLSGIKKDRVHYHRFMLDIHERLRLLPRSPDPLIIIGKQIAENIQVLCLDEFHVNDVADAMLLSGLLNTLFKNGVTLVATSNTEINNLYLNGLQRERFMHAIELLNTHTEEIDLHVGKDYRLEHLESGEIFLTDPAKAQQDWMAEKMRELSPTEIQYQTVVSIHNRDIQVVAISNDVAWFEFNEICDTPRAAKDYLTIAIMFHTVLISNIPKLVAAKDSAAKRFMHLIDALYDRRVKLIASSEMPPEQLYEGVLLTGIFERTVSRLIEMSSHDYLATPHRS